MEERTDISIEAFEHLSKGFFTTPSAVLSSLITAILCADFDDVNMTEFVRICDKVFINNSECKYEIVNNLDNEKTDDIYTSPFALKPKIIFKHIADNYPTMSAKNMMYSMIKCAIMFSDLSKWSKDDFISYCKGIISVKPTYLVKKTLLETLIFAIAQKGPEQSDQEKQIN